MRNATMSGYGLANVVIEAGETSGARALARMAIEHGRQAILTNQVVVQNQWAQRLVGRPGVHVANSVGDVMHMVEQVVAMRDDLQIEVPLPPPKAAVKGLLLAELRVPRNNQSHGC